MQEKFSSAVPPSEFISTAVSDGRYTESVATIIAIIIIAINLHPARYF